MQSVQSLIHYCQVADSKLHTWNSTYRADTCAKIFPTFPPVFQDFHNATYVTQINGVPEGSKCAVSGEPLSGGVQLKFNGRHICIHSTYYNVWYHYFRIRHFPCYIYQLKSDVRSTEKKWNTSIAILQSYIYDTI